MNQLDYARRWVAKNKDTPLYKYKMHAVKARHRGVPFLLTFEEWWQLWQDSGHWTERGRRRGQYVMSRPGDQGAYEISNVVIRTNTENASELVRRSPPAKGRPKSEQHRKRLSEAAIRQWRHP